MKPSVARQFLSVLSIVLASLILGGATRLLAVCGPFTDVVQDSFCPFVMEIFYMGITTGTTPATYDPAANVSRLQMAAFLSRGVDGILKRGSRRAALNQFWTARSEAWGYAGLGGNGPAQVASDGTDAWVAVNGSGTLVRVRGTDDTVLQTWTGATNATGVVVTPGFVFVTGSTSPGQLYYINQKVQGINEVSTWASVGNAPAGAAFDGSRVWTANTGGSVSIVPISASPAVMTVTTGFSSPFGAVYDGANVWVTDQDAGTLLKLDGTGAILQTVTIGTLPKFPVFDGTNFWVPDYGSASVSVVRASSGAVLATLTGNGLSLPFSAAFDGSRILVTNNAGGSGSSVFLWKAVDLTPLGSLDATPDSLPFGACSDGHNFWVTLHGTRSLARF